VGNIRHKGHFFLEPLPTATAASTPLLSGIKIGELANDIYASFGLRFHKYNNGTDDWGSSLVTLAATPTDILTVRMPDGTVYLIIAQTNDYDYTSDGAAFTRSTKDVKYLAFWDNRLWGIDNTGQLWFSITLGTEVNDAKLPVPDGEVTDLFVGPLPNGEQGLYAATQTGLWVHDPANQRFIQTGLVLPRYAGNGTGCAVWRGDIYFPAGRGIYKYSVGSGGAVISAVGPDRENGLPAKQQGDIELLVATHNGLIALTQGATGGNGMVMEYDGRGWAMLFRSTLITTLDVAYAGSAYSTYRLWFHDVLGRISYLPLATNLLNPLEVTTQDYGTIGELQTPWFTAAQDEVDKLAVRLRVQVDGASADETVKVEYGTNWDTSTFTTLGTITADGITTYDFPNSTTPTGTVFRAIWFKITLSRGATTTKTPDVLSITLEYRKKLPALWGHTCEVEIRDYNGQSAKEMRSNLLTAIESTTLVEFTFRDDDGDTRNFYVDLVQATGLEQTGHNEGGTSRLVMVER